MRLQTLAKSQDPPVMASSVCTVKISYELARNLTVISLSQLINVNEDISALRGFKITKKKRKENAIAKLQVWQNFRPILNYQCFQRPGSDQKATANNQNFKLLTCCINIP